MVNAPVKTSAKFAVGSDSCPVANALARERQWKKPALPESWVHTGVGTMLA